MSSAFWITAKEEQISHERVIVRMSLLNTEVTIDIL